MSAPGNTKRTCSRRWRTIPGCVGSQRPVRVRSWPGETAQVGGVGGLDQLQRGFGAIPGIDSAEHTKPVRYRHADLRQPSPGHLFVGAVDDDGEEEQLTATTGVPRATGWGRCSRCGRRSPDWREISLIHAPRQSGSEQHSEPRSSPAEHRSTLWGNSLHRAQAPAPRTWSPR
jgi:hypothetical protein